MSRSSLHNEENFWPCVSDMFLALFVIALVLYSTATNEKGKGDKNIDAQMVEEACELFDDLAKLYPERASSLVYNLRKENDKGEHEELARRLCSLTAMDSPIRDLFTGTAPIEGKSCHEAINHLYENIKGEVDRNMVDSPFYDRKMKIIRQRIIKHISKTQTQDLTPRQMKEKIETLEKENALLKDKLAKSGEAKLRAQINFLENKLERLLNQDKRGVVMEKAKSILEQRQVAGAVHIEKDLGIIRIPASSISFVQGESDKLMEDRQLDILSKISAVLVDIAEEDADDKLIDNIVIECHADQTGDADENERLSSERAVWVWKTLNQTSGGKLATYRNSSGLGLFSHAGFGSRVPVTRKENETKRDFWRRCRRIDIRFNCSPQVQAIDE